MSSLKTALSQQLASFAARLEDMQAKMQSIATVAHSHAAPSTQKHGAWTPRNELPFPTLPASVFPANNLFADLTHTTDGAKYNILDNNWSSVNAANYDHSRNHDSDSQGTGTSRIATPPRRSHSPAPPITRQSVLATPQRRTPTELSNQKVRSHSTSSHTRQTPTPPLGVPVPATGADYVISNDTLNANSTEGLSEKQQHDLQAHTARGKNESDEEEEGVETNADRGTSDDGEFRMIRDSVQREEEVGVVRDAVEMEIKVQRTVASPEAGLSQEHASPQVIDLKSGEDREGGAVEDERAALEHTPHLGRDGTVIHG